MAKGGIIQESMCVYGGVDVPLRKMKFLNDGSMLILSNPCVGFHSHYWQNRITNRIEGQVTDEKRDTRVRATLKPNEVRDRIIKRWEKG